MARTKVFISYSYKDTEWLERLQVHLKPLEREGLDRWDDTRILEGDDWYAEISKALKEAAVAVLLISADFLASDFIAEKELPPLLAAAETEGVRILPVILSPSRFTKTKLGRFQSVNPPTNPLIGMDKVDQEALLVKVADAVEVALNRLALTKEERDAGTQRKPWNVPDRNFYFTGREKLLADLRTQLEQRGRAMLSGLGGVGKSQTAIEYAFRHREAYEAVLWVGADTPEALASNFAALARALDLPERDEREQAVQVAAVKRWLADHDGWLLIFDSADHDPGKTLTPYWLNEAKGHLLVTSRRNQAQRLGITNGLTTEELPPQDALDFLLKRTGREDAEESEREAAATLAHEVDGLPLALEQAAAYIVQISASFADYLSAYLQQPIDVLERGEPVAGGYRDSVAKTWLLNFKQVEAESLASADVLRAAAFLAPDDIPLELFVDGAAELGDNIAAALGTDDPLALHTLLEPLTRFSLVRRDVNQQTFDVHALVQEVVRAMLQDEEGEAWKQRALQAMNAVFPYVEFETWSLCERLLPHARLIATRINHQPSSPIVAARLLNQIAYYLHDRAAYAEVEPLYRRALAIYEQALGPEHPSTAASQNNLAILLSVQGKYGEAEPLYRRALDIREQALGPEHSDTAQSLNNLAEFLRGQGKYEEAEPLYRRALDIREQAFGPEHSSTAAILNNLALMLKNQGKYAEAEPLYRRALAVNKKAFGPDHPYTALILNNLAALLYDQGKYGEAEPLYRRALDIRVQALGHEHPDTAQSLNNLAEFLRGQGKYEEAEPLYRRALDICEQALGPDHPNTKTVGRNYELFLQERGRDEEE